MKQMNKEELIDFFINELGDNEILGNVMTIEQIRKKLNSVISSVKYFNGEDDSKRIGFWNPLIGTVNFDLKKISQLTEDDVKTSIVHEMLHALSTSDSMINPKNIANLKVGVQYFSTDIETFNYNFGINEGITEALAEEITKNHIYNNGYRYETDNIYIRLCTLIGREEITRLYFVDINTQNILLPNELFKDSIIKKFGILGENISGDITKILTLTDIITNYGKQKELNKYSKMCLQKCKDEIEKTFTKIYTTIIDNEKDYAVKAEKMINYEDLTDFKTIKMEENRLFDSILNMEVTDMEKIRMIKEIVKTFNVIPSKSGQIVNLILESSIDNDEKKELLERIDYSEEAFNILSKNEIYNSLLDYQKLRRCPRNDMSYYNLFVQEGWMTAKRFKQGIMSEFYKYNRTIKSVKGQIDEYRYKKIGNFYLISEKKEFDDESEHWYDDKGKKMDLKNISSYKIGEMQKYGNPEENIQQWISEEFQKENLKWEKLKEIINDCQKDYKEQYENTSETMWNVKVIGNICVVKIFNRKFQKNYNYFEIGDNGEIVRLEPRS